MRELVTTEQAERVLRLLAAGLPIAGLVIGTLLGAIRRRVARGVLAGLLLGLLGPAAFGLWHIYNGIMGHYGLDSVKGLLINLALFSVVGLAIGVAVGWAMSRARGRAASSESASAGRG